MTVTVTLKDAQDNAVTGASSSLTTETVTVANATQKSGSSWRDNGDGTYTATYTATTAGTGLKATLRLSGWSGSAQSAEYAIISITVKDVTVNGYTFAEGSGFPTTGFTGATFTINISPSPISDFSWTSDASWVSVDNGVVKFTGDGTGDVVTILATPKGGGYPAKYSFKLNSWFINRGSSYYTWNNANRSCQTETNYSLPTSQQLNGNGSRQGTRGDIGGLWSEWGRLTNYDANFDGQKQFWSDSSDSSGYHYWVSLLNGDATQAKDSVLLSVTCRKAI